MGKTADKINSIQLYEDITVAVKQPEIVLQIRHSGSDKGSLRRPTIQNLPKILSGQILPLKCAFILGIII
jgi:hypothetical protein